MPAGVGFLIGRRGPRPSRRPIRPWAAGLLVAAGLAGACRAPAAAEPGPAEAPLEEWIAGRSVEGRPIRCRSFGSGEGVVLVLAGIHGDEPAGTPLLEELGRRLRDRPALVEGGRVVLLPIANPDGLTGERRTNARGVDLNRNFPAANWRGGGGQGREPLSEPESRALLELIEEHRPRAVISVHQPLGCIDYDGPGEELARAMGAVSELPVRRLGLRAGSLGSLVGADMGVPIATLELPAAASGMESGELWSRYGPALLAGIGKGLERGSDQRSSRPRTGR